ncbi:serine hydrolase domain-containing protein [Altererythrobacter sp. ZODW24]|uniref:serine hydrolase domain-containing protein n=1 Tax=Altererythrobacter sp. ZODW24 TaxID=2185142 RepID=UPI0013B44ADF|nr:serine hydrolase domain-containing protein [Altererythrobacter sp. ZODW24]
MAEPNKVDLDELLDKYANEDGFNGTVVIARDGKIITSKSYGLANVELGVPNNPSLAYRVGSVTKPLTATLTFALIEKGQLRLDGTLGEYLPDLYAGTAIANVTLGQLLSHSSGIVDVPQRFEDPFYRTTARMSFEPKQYAKEWIKPELVEEPGTKWRYNNNAFLLVGAIISEVTGKSYAAAMQEHVFGPAGMTSSGVANTVDIVPGLATGYARDKDGNPVKPLYFDPSVFYAAAGVYSTAEDMLRFDRALYGNEIMSEAQRNLMHSAQVRIYAYGWGVGSYDLPDGSKLAVVEHTGSVPGYQSNYVRSERNRDFVFVVSNYWQGSLVQGMGRDLMEVLNGKPPRKITELLLPALESGGLPAMIAAYDGLGESAVDYNRSEKIMNDFGYRLVGEKNLAAAIAVFEWNVAAYPDSANTHDSLGESYRAAGRNSEALVSYYRSLELNPESESAKTNIAEMQAGTE